MPDNSFAISTSGIATRRLSDDLGNDKLLHAIEVVLEPAALALSVWLVGFGFEGQLPPAYLILSALVFAFAFPGTSRLQSSFGQLVTEIAFGWFLLVCTLLTLGFITGMLDEFSRRAMLTWLLVAPLAQTGASLALRAIAPLLLKLKSPARKAIIVGMNEQGKALAARIGTAPYARIELAGFFDDRGPDRLVGIDDLMHVGQLSELPAFVKANRIQLIYLSLPMTSQPRIIDVLNELKDTTASIYFVPDMFVTDLIQSSSGAVCGFLKWLSRRTIA